MKLICLPVSFNRKSYPDYVEGEEATPMEEGEEEEVEQEELEEDNYALVLPSGKSVTLSKICVCLVMYFSFSP